MYYNNNLKATKSNTLRRQNRTNHFLAIWSSCSRRILNKGTIWSWSGRLSLMTAACRKFSAQAWRRGNMSGSRSFTPTTSSITGIHRASIPYAKSTMLISSPPKNFSSPNAFSSSVCSTSNVAFLAFSLSSSPSARNTPQSTGLCRKLID